MAIEGDNNNNTLWGTNSDDFIYGYGGNDTLYGLDGNDYLHGDSGNDYLFGGTGMDTAMYRAATAGVWISLLDTSAQYTGGDGTDTLNSIENIQGSEFDDYLYGTNGDNRLDGWGGNDWLYGYGGNDILWGDDGNDDLSGGGGNDTLRGGSGTDTAMYREATAGVNVSLLITTAQNTIGAGTDTLIDIEDIEGSGYSDILKGNNGDNRFDAYGGNDSLYGYGGNDRLYGYDGHDLIWGGDGNDLIWGGYGNDYLYGGAGNDILRGEHGTDTAMYRAATAEVNVSLLITTAQNTIGDGTDTLVDIENIQGSFFNDTLTGNNGGNRLDGWDGNDALYGNGGNDILYGYDGSDVLFGGDGDDVLYGGAGYDCLQGGSGNDSLYGQAGTDTARYKTAISAVSVNLTITTAQATGGAGSDTLQDIENLVGSNFNDTLIGNVGNNYLAGGNGNDSLLGAGGKDILQGGLGNDVLYGGLGNDNLAGGAGLDTFVFNIALNASTNKDSISDFSVVNDTIVLDKTIFAKLAIGTLNSQYFKASANGLADDNTDFILYNTDSGALMYDADANGAGVAVQFATLTTTPTITASDFLVVA